MVKKKTKTKTHVPVQETWETGVPSLGRKDALEEGTATHSSILAWRVPWTQESGRLHSPWGCKEPDTTEVTQHIHTHLCSKTAEVTFKVGCPQLRGPPEGCGPQNGRLEEETWRHSCSFLVVKCRHHTGLPGGSDGEESAFSAFRPRFNPWVGKISGRRKW